ncbi:MAG TPA: hypothetical protein VGN37_08250 [Actinocatenispora sp.]
MNIEDVAAQLRAAVTGLHRAIGALGRARTEVERAGQYTAAATRASTDPRPRHAHAAYQQAVGKAGEIEALLAAGRDAVTAYLAHIEGTTSSAAGNATGDPAPPTTAGPGPLLRRGLPSPGHRGVPEHVRDAARRLRSRTPDDQMWANGKGPEWTDGLATNDDDGHAVLGGGVMTSAGAARTATCPA